MCGRRDRGWLGCRRVVYAGRADPKPVARRIRSTNCSVTSPAQPPGPEKLSPECAEPRLVKSLVENSLPKNGGHGNVTGALKALAAEAGPKSSPLEYPAELFRHARD